MDYNEQLLDTEMKLRDRGTCEYCGRDCNGIDCGGFDLGRDLPEEPTLPGEDDELDND